MVAGCLPVPATGQHGLQRLHRNTRWQTDRATALTDLGLPCSSVGSGAATSAGSLAWTVRESQRIRSPACAQTSRASPSPSRRGSLALRMEQARQREIEHRARLGTGAEDARRGTLGCLVWPGLAIGRSARANGALAAGELRCRGRRTLWTRSRRRHGRLAARLT